MLSWQFTVYEKMQTNTVVNECYLVKIILTFLSNWLPWEFSNTSNFPTFWTSQSVTLGVYIHLLIQHTFTDCFLQLDQFGKLCLDPGDTVTILNTAFALYIPYFSVGVTYHDYTFTAWSHLCSYPIYFHFLSP